LSVDQIGLELAEWGRTFKVAIGTQGLSCGYDRADISEMLIVGQLDTLTDTVQAFGRAGRGRQFSKDNPACVTMLWSHNVSNKSRQHVNNPSVLELYRDADSFALNEFLHSTGKCLNLTLSSAFDSIPSACFGSKTAMCTVCENEFGKDGLCSLHFNAQISRTFWMINQHTYQQRKKRLSPLLLIMNHFMQKKRSSSAYMA
jgi:hypothetical protein